MYVLAHMCLRHMSTPIVRQVGHTQTASWAVCVLDDWSFLSFVRCESVSRWTSVVDQIVVQRIVCANKNIWNMSIVEEACFL